MSHTSDYVVGVMIGEGSYGRVLHARHKATKRDVAIKVVEKLGLNKHPNLYHSVWTERKLLSEWDSNYVVKLLASFHDSECLYMVMDCVMGGDLTSTIREGLEENKYDLWLSSIPHYGLQILAALEFVHSQGVVHADLKPDNVLISRNGHIKLIDFGSAVSLSLDLQDKNEQTTMVMGTSDYASPELLRASQNLTFAVDLWSLGCIFYSMLCGQSPFHADSDALAVQAVLEYPKKQNDAVVKNMVQDSLWQELIVGMLNPQPCLRLGYSDIVAVGQPVEYQSIRSFDVLNSVQLSVDPKFVPSIPKWVAEEKDSTLRDGSIGWSAFLL